MPIKIYKNTSYSSYKENAGKEKNSAEAVSLKKKARSSSTKDLNSFLTHNKFFVLSLILLGISVVLIGYLVIVLVEFNQVTTHTIFEEDSIQSPVVEILKMPEMNIISDEPQSDLWECTDGSFMSTPEGQQKCQKIPSVNLPSGSGNKFITKENVFSDEQ